jgi:hypothetical protein
MSEWLDDLGTERFTDAQLELIINILKVVIEAKGEFKEDEIAEYLAKFDIAIDNITNIKEKVKGAIDGRQKRG